jgi:hypothetical protein
MSLALYVPPRVNVTMNAGENPLTVSVRGLNLIDIAVLVADHLEEFRALAKIWTDAQQEIFASVQQDNFILNLITQTPTIAAMVIALATDEKDSVLQAASLPIAFQVRVLLEIIRLTLEDAGGPKGFAALMLTTIRQAN